MTNLSTASPSAETISQLTDMLFAHLAVEETSLTDMRESLVAVRNALLHNDPMALEAGLRQQADVAARLEEVVQRRTDRLLDWSNALGIELAALTLKKLTDWLVPEDASRLLEVRERLRVLAAEVQRLNRSNSMLVNHSIDMTRQVIAELSPQGMSGEGYNATGSRQESAGGPMIQVGG